MAGAGSQLGADASTYASRKPAASCAHDTHRRDRKIADAGSGLTAEWLGVEPGK